MKKVSLVLALLLVLSSSAAFATDGMVTPVLISQPITENPVSEGIPFDVTYDGDEFTITVDENPTTGYSWTYMIKDLEKVSFIGDEYIGPEGEMIGAGGKKAATFKSIDLGVSTILFSYKRPWEDTAIETLDILVYKTEDRLIVEENSTLYAMDTVVGISEEVEKTVSYEGTLVPSDKDMMVIDGVTMLPLRDTLEAMGYTVTWNNDTRSVEIVKGAQWTEIYIDQNRYFKNRMAPWELSHAPVIRNSSTFIPVEFFVEIIGMGIEVESGNINFVASEMAIHQGFIKDMTYDETGGLRITITSDMSSEDMMNDTIIHTSSAFTYYNKELEVGMSIKVISPPIMTMSIPGQTSGLVVY